MNIDKKLMEIISRYTRDLFLKTTELDLIQAVRPLTDQDRRAWRMNKIEKVCGEIKAIVVASLPEVKDPYPEWFDVTAYEKGQEYTRGEMLKQWSDKSNG